MMCGKIYSLTPMEFGGDAYVLIKVYKSPKHKGCVKILTFSPLGQKTTQKNGVSEILSIFL